jgi:small subunit ribosomal protein S7
MRKRRVGKRQILPDAKYKSTLVARFISIVMKEGKKSLAERIVYDSLDILRQKTGKENVLEALQKAIDNVRPALQVKSRRVGGATYQVPVEVRPDKGISLSLRWIRDFARVRKGRPMQEKIADELFDAYKGEGAAVKKKEDTHKMAEANRAFAHFRW